MTDIAAPPEISAGTARSYAAVSSLFTDWCAAADRTPLPADPATVLDFLAECPAAPATQRRRVTAIHHHHSAKGLPSPGDDDRVRAAVGRPPHDRIFMPHNVDAVHAALRLLPSAGWTGGVFGRRDRCLLVLAEFAGVPYQHIASLTAGDIGFDGGPAVITADGVTFQLEPGDDAVLCPTCALARWLEILDVAARQLATIAIAQHLREADHVSPNSPHHWRQPMGIDPRTREQPLLAPIDQWGSFPFPLRPLSPHAVSRQTRDLVAGDLVMHRDRPAPGTDDATKSRTMPPTSTTAPPPYRPADWAAAVHRRRDELAQLAPVADDLADVERRAAELNHRVVQLLEDVALRPSS